MKKIFVLLVALLFCALVLGGCAGKTSASPSNTTPPPYAATTSVPVPKTSVSPATQTALTPQSGGTLREGEAVFPSAGVGWQAEVRPFMSTPLVPPFFDALITGDDKGNFSPNLATKWDIASDLSSITMTIRQGVKFHDGSDLNSAVVKWNLDQLINAKISDYASCSSAEVIDPYTVKLNVKSYNNTLIDTLASTYIVSKATYDAHGGGKEAIEWMRWNPVGTGPFKFASYTPNVSIKGVKFNDYWQKGKPYLDAIEIYYISDPMTKSASFQAGELDVIDQSLSRVEYELQQKGFEVIKNYCLIFTLAPDNKNSDSPLSNLKVRQAIDYAIDRDSLVKNLGYGFWKTTYQNAVPGSSSYINDLPARAYNPEKAKQLLAEAGFTSGFKLSLIANTSVVDSNLMTAIQGFLSKVNINAELNMVDAGAYTTFNQKGWTNGLIASGNRMDTNVHRNLAMGWIQNSNTNFSVLKTNEFQGLYDASVTAKNFDPVLMQKIVRYISDNAMFFPLLCQSQGVVQKPFVHDTGFMTKLNITQWNPANAWISK
jgi:peptide/nickel transport system substrate-binding protein